MALKGLLRRRTRTLLTVGGIAIGVAAIVSLGALADGFIAGYSAIVGGSGADLLVVQKDALDIVLSAVDEDLGAVLTGFADVRETSEMIYTFAATDGVPYFIVYGYDPDGFAIQHFKIIAGEPLSRHSGRRGGKPLLLGQTAANDLGKSVGDTFRLYDSTYRIVGIYETGQPFEDGAAVILLEDAQTISGKPRQVNAFFLKVREGSDIDRLSQRIEQRFPDLTVTRSADFVQQQEMLQYVYVFTWSVSLIAILIGGIGVMNTMLMSVFERTREFGVLRALGWRPYRVLGLVLAESLALSGLGGLLGALLGVVGVRAIERVPAISSVMPAALSAPLFAQGFGVALALGLVGGALPAWRAARLLPVEALRAEGGSDHAWPVPWATLRNVLRQPIRTLLTMAGIGIAIMAIVVLQAMGDGMVKAISDMAGSGGAHLVGSEADASIDLSKIDVDVVRRIAALPGVRMAEGFLTGYTTVGELPFFIVFGYQINGLAIRSYRIVEGEPLTANRQIILGRVAARNLGKGVGQTLRLFNSSFRIVGIYETGVPFQDGGGVVSLRDAQALFGQPRQVSFLGVWLEDPQQADAVLEEVAARFPQVALARASAFAENVGDIQVMRASTWAIAGMALLVGGLGVTNTMMMGVFERTREIGVLRALGWRKRRVVGMIVRESLALSAVGGVVGMASGVIFGLLLNLNPLLGGWMHVEYRLPHFAQALGTALLLGALGGAYPAWRASRLQPVEALRYE